MNTPFGKPASLDITNSYPTGLMAQLGPYYNDSQDLINAQIRFAANQADIISKENSIYAIQNIELEKTGTIAPVSASTQSEATVYINQANQVNYLNQQIAASITTQYTNAYAIEKSCKDAGYSSFLTREASQIRVDRLSTNNIALQIANLPIYINPMNMILPSTISTTISNRIQASQNALNDASGNVQSYITNTQNLLNNAIIKSSSVTENLYLVAALNTLIKSIAQVISDPLLEILDNDTLVTQSISSISLSSSISLAKITNNYLDALISNINGTTVDLSGNILAISNLTVTLDSMVKIRDINLYLRDAIQNNLMNAALGPTRNKLPITYPINGKISPYYIANQEIEADAKAAAYSARLAGELIVAAATDTSGAQVAARTAVVAAATAASAISPIEAKRLSLNANKSAENARNISNAIINLNTAFNNTNTLEPVILINAIDTLNTIKGMISTAEKVINNKSASVVLSLSRTASNGILGILNKITEKEKVSLQEAADSNSVLLLLNYAQSINATIADTVSIENKHWAINAAIARAKEVSDKLKEKVLLLNRSANNSMTPSKIAVQTAQANIAGSNLANAASRIGMLSRNIFPLPPPAYSGFKADTRATISLPNRPSLNELVFRNRIEPLRLDSVRTINATNVKIAQEVQQINDMSIFSFRQQ